MGTILMKIPCMFFFVICCLFNENFSWSSKEICYFNLDSSLWWRYVGIRAVAVSCHCFYVLSGFTATCFSSFTRFRHQADMVPAKILHKSPYIISWNRYWRYARKDFCWYFYICWWMWSDWQEIFLSWRSHCGEDIQKQG